MKKLNLNFFTNINIGKKLIILTISITVTALLIAGIFQSTMMISRSKSNLTKMTTITADVIGSQSAAALEFMDVDAAKENLQALKSNAIIKQVCLYDENSKIFTEYRSDTLSSSIYVQCPNQIEQGSYFTENRLNVTRAISENNQIIGSIYVAADLGEHYASIVKYIYSTLISTIVAICIAYFLSRKLHKKIVDPINNLSNSAKSFALKQDYSIRIQNSSRDEVGLLSRTFNDMLEQMQKRDSELVNARNEAERANKMKSEFLANMSHELRTPLNCQLILAELLAANIDGNLTDSQVEEITMIHDNGKELLALINDILDLAKVESGKLSTTVDHIDIDELCNSIEKQFTPISEKNGLYFRVYREPNTPLFFHSDYLKLNQILKNFISNAQKFTHTGGVTLRIDSEKDAEVNNEGISMIFSVTDTGIGIAEEKQSTIFDSFQQADGSTSRRYGGTGLGLTLARRFSELLDGEIEVTSREGKGSTFALRIPIKNHFCQSACELKNAQI